MLALVDLSLVNQKGVLCPQSSLDSLPHPVLCPGLQETTLFKMCPTFGPAHILKADVNINLNSKDRMVEIPLVLG